MLDHHDVRVILPQRHPLLLVDRVLELRQGRFIRTVKAVTGTEPCYALVPEGAAAWQYRYPPALIIESFGQSAALLWSGGVPPDPADRRTLMFVSATDVRFEGSALPGDVLRHDVRLDSVIADVAFASGEIWVGDRRIAQVGGLAAARRPIALPDASQPPGGNGRPHRPGQTERESA